MRRRPLNPVLALELRSRVRGGRGTFAITAYLGFASAILYFVYQGAVNAQRQSLGFGGDPTQRSDIGRTMFATLVLVMLLGICFIVPGVCAGAVAGEKERQTLVPLQISLLSPFQILWGKLLASLAFVVLLIVATLPLLAVALAYGGVSPTQVLRSVAMLLATAALLGCLSLWASSLLGRVQRATVFSFGLVLLLVLGTPAAFVVQGIARQSRDGGGSLGGTGDLLLLTPNPFMAVADVVRSPGSSSQTGPFSPFVSLLERRDTGGDSFDQLAQAAPAFAVPATVVAGVADDVVIGGKFVPPPPVAPAPDGGGPTTTAVILPPGAVIEPAPPPGQLPPTTAPGAFPAPLPPTQPGSDGSGIDTSTSVVTSPGRPWTSAGPFWLWSVCGWLVLSVAALAHATRRLRLPTRSTSRLA